MFKNCAFADVLTRSFHLVVFILLQNSLPLDHLHFLQIVEKQFIVIRTLYTVELVLNKPRRTRRVFEPCEIFADFPKRAIVSYFYGAADIGAKALLQPHMAWKNDVFQTDKARTFHVHCDTRRTVSKTLYGRRNEFNLLLYRTIVTQWKFANNLHTMSIARRNKK